MAKRHRDKLRAWKLHQKSILAASLTLTQFQLQQLIDDLDVHFQNGGHCLRQFQFLQQWLKVRSIEPEPVEQTFLRLGFTCDCELSLNLTEEMFF